MNTDRKLEIQSAYQALQEDIRQTAVRAGRPADSVRLIAVTKNFDTKDIDAILDLGHKDLGENKVQELTGKIDHYEAENKFCNWHMIGTLQRNKVRQIVGRVAMIHSVDSLRLIKEIEKRSAQAGCVTDVLLQVNISGEKSKQGFQSEEIEPILQERERFSHIRFRGLMTMAPHFEDPEETRPIFRETRLLQEALCARMDLPGFDHLSMGMTNDYHQAIVEGSTMLRIGSAIFGSRYQ
ncbi:MAG: YggS family pyridoxal phosphate-dependent enzyme [Eubacteriales bacterium]|nr:YggS family pyridoxal phosphate-dependent enzyme [Eubacteriales bacterium]